MACRWFDFSRRLLSVLACQQGRSHQSQCWPSLTVVQKLRFAMWTRVSRPGTCKALLSAIGIWIDSRSISIDEVFDSEGIASRTMSVNVSKNDIDRLVSISRSFTWNNEKMKVLFTRVDPIPAPCFCTSFQWFPHAWWHTCDNIYITNDEQAISQVNCHTATSHQNKVGGCIDVWST